MTPGADVVRDGVAERRCEATGPGNPLELVEYVFGGTEVAGVGGHASIPGQVVAAAAR